MIESFFISRYLKIPLIFLSFLILAVDLYSQVSHGGSPPSFTDRSIADDIEQLNIPPPDMATIVQQDLDDEQEGLPARIAVSVPVNRSIEESGTWTSLSGRKQIWRLKLSCAGASAMNISFSDFYLPANARLFIYNPDRSCYIGAFINSNNRNNHIFSTELIPGDAIILELETASEVRDEIRLLISEISYAYRFIPDFITRRGSSGDCEVNINCPEGNDWQDQKRSVARIYVKSNGGFFWCTGSLLNNTRQDRQPLFLTADHCAPVPTVEDLSKWVFYFNYEAPGCENPATTPESKTLTGATLLAHASTVGSDFMLLKLDEDVPVYYEPYYNGWNRENLPSPDGVTIHHPAGDIKKISTYTSPLISSKWGGIPGTHWEVTWTQTDNGWGVTEGGSSGAPLFDNYGRVVGTLTGGQSDCDAIGSNGPDQPDYYGKFSYSWDQNGNTAEVRLKDWLDPDDSGVMWIDGMNASLHANFDATDRVILTGENVSYSNLSSGQPISWQWIFEGGDPGSFAGAQPPAITYPGAGIFSVSLIVSDGSASDTTTKTDYIEVVGKVYPNPATDRVNIYLGDNIPETITIEVFNILGASLYREEITGNQSAVLPVDLTGLARGVYSIRLEFDNRFLLSKVIVVK